MFAILVTDYNMAPMATKGSASSWTPPPPDRASRASGTSQTGGFFGTISNFFGGHRESVVPPARKRRPSDASSTTARSYMSRMSQGSRSLHEVVERARSAEQRARDHVLPAFLRDTQSTEQVTHDDDTAAPHNRRPSSSSGGRRSAFWDFLDPEYHPDSDLGEHNYFVDVPDHPQLSVLEDTKTAPIDTENFPDLFALRRRPSAELRDLASLASRDDSESVFYDAQSTRDGHSIRRPSSFASRSSFSQQPVSVASQAPTPAAGKMGGRDLSDGSFSQQMGETAPEVSPESKEKYDDTIIVNWDGEDDAEHPMVRYC